MLSKFATLVVFLTEIMDCADAAEEVNPDAAADDNADAGEETALLGEAGRQERTPDDVCTSCAH